LTEKLKMHRVAAKFVPRLLTEEQKQNRVSVSQELLDRSNANENFLQNVITGDETWVYGCGVETNVQSTLKGRRFQTIEEIKENSQQDLRAITQNTFQDALQNWKKPWERCINSRGEYFEGDKSD